MVDRQSIGTHSGRKFSLYGSSSVCNTCRLCLLRTVYSPALHCLESISQSVAGKMRRQIDHVTSFLDGLVVYVLSREWHDLFSIYIFKLHPLPHCSQGEEVRFGFFGLKSFTDQLSGSSAVDVDQKAPTCSPEADFETQISSLFLLLLIGVVVQISADRMLSTEIGTAVVSIAGMTVGWSAGDAAIRLHVERALAQMHSASVLAADANVAPGAVATVPPVAVVTEQAVSPGGGYLYGFGTTLVCLAAILVFEPFTVHAIAVILHRGAQRCLASWVWLEERCQRAIDLFEEWTLALAALTARALTVVVLMVWTYVAQLNLTAGLAAEASGPLQRRLQVLWAISLTLAGAVRELNLNPRHSRARSLDPPDV